MTADLQFALRQLADETRPIHSINLAPMSDLTHAQAGQFSAAWVALTPGRRLTLLTSMVEQAEANIHLNFHTILRGRLSDADCRIRKLAIEGLWEDERCSLIAPLAQLLAEDPDPEVRAAAAGSLGRFVLLGVLAEIGAAHAQQAEHALHAAWFRPLELSDVRRRALEGLAYSNAPHIREMIDTAYYDEDPHMRQSALFAMGRNADRRWARVVLAELDSRDAAMRYEAAGAAGELALRAAVTPLVRLLQDVDSNIREAAALALGKIGGKTARRALEAAAQSRDDRLAEAAEEALEELIFNHADIDHVLMAYEKDAEEDEDAELLAGEYAKDNDDLYEDDDVDLDDADDAFIDDFLLEDDDALIDDLWEDEDDDLTWEDEANEEGTYDDGADAGEDGDQDW